MSPLAVKPFGIIVSVTPATPFVKMFVTVEKFLAIMFASLIVAAVTVVT